MSKVQSVVEFIFIGVVLKALIAQTIGAWFIKGFNKLFAYIFVRTRRELIIWLHFNNKRAKHHTADLKRITRL